VDEELDPETLLRAYALGIFPMSDGRDARELHWIDPRRRGVLPLDGFRVSRSLARRLRRADFRVSVDTDFRAVVEACAERSETWISHRIQQLYLKLHDAGAAHSVEVWENDRLVGGVYGVALGAAFFGESMFSRVTDGSKIALAHLVHRLQVGRFRLFDTQFTTPHLASLGGLEISRGEYHLQLADALCVSASFFPDSYSPSSSDVASGAGSGRMQFRTQTS
jgi:leucyl/phenylalanyl-tRNA---protein transferase